MKKRLKPPNAPNEGRGRPTLLEFMASYHAAAGKLTGLEEEATGQVEAKPLPQWGVKTLDQLRKTVMRPVLKLKPHGKTNCKDYGKIIGVVERQITFLEVDIWEIMLGEGWDKIPKEEWEKIQPEAQMRDHLIRLLKRKVGDDEKTEDLAVEAWERKIENHKAIRQAAFEFISTRSAKERGMFYDGLAQGYKLFMDEAGKLCGDRGRTEIYTELLASQYEIEKMRRMLPAKNDGDLYDHLKAWYKFPRFSREQNIEWLRDVCDDVSLYMTGKRGRPAGVAKHKTVLAL